MVDSQHTIGFVAPLVEKRAVSSPISSNDITFRNRISRSVAAKNIRKLLQGYGIELFTL